MVVAISQKPGATQLGNVLSRSFYAYSLKSPS